MINDADIIDKYNNIFYDAKIIDNFKSNIINI